MLRYCDDATSVRHGNVAERATFIALDLYVT